MVYVSDVMVDISDVIVDVSDTILMNQGFNLVFPVAFKASSTFIVVTS